MLINQIQDDIGNIILGLANKKCSVCNNLNLRDEINKLWIPMYDEPYKDSRRPTKPISQIDSALVLFITNLLSPYLI